MCCRCHQHSNSVIILKFATLTFNTRYVVSSRGWGSVKEAQVRSVQLSRRVWTIQENMVLTEQPAHSNCHTHNPNTHGTFAPSQQVSRSLISQTTSKSHLRSEAAACDTSLRTMTLTASARAPLGHAIIASNAQRPRQGMQRMDAYVHNMHSLMVHTCTIQHGAHKCTKHYPCCF